MAWWWCEHAKLLQSCLTFCNPMGCSPSCSSVHGILQARILGWVAVPSSMGSSWPRDRTWVFYVSCIGRWVLHHWHHLGRKLWWWIWPILKHAQKTLVFPLCFSLCASLSLSISLSHTQFVQIVKPNWYILSEGPWFIYIFKVKGKSWTISHQKQILKEFIRLPV